MNHSKMTMTRRKQHDLMLVDDHQIVRDGIRSLLNDQPGLRIVAEAQDGLEALDLLEQRPVDLALVDISMPGMNGIDCTARIRKKFPQVRVLALTMLKEEQHIRHMLRAGASGYILKDAGKDELLKGISAVLRGENFFSSEASQVVMMDLVGKSAGKKAKPQQHEPIYLTEREKDVLKLVVKELTNQEIAQQLHISHRTVDAYRRSLIQKVGARNSIGLVKFALENGLVEGSED